MGEACSTYERREKCVQNFREDSVAMYHKEAGCEVTYWIHLA